MLQKECVEKLINYVKLLLLFTDDRFDIVVEEENMYEEDLRGNKQKSRNYGAIFLIVLCDICMNKIWMNNWQKMRGKDQFKELFC